MHAVKLFLWASCASRLQAHALEEQLECEVSTRTIACVTELSYSFATGNSSSGESDVQETAGLPAHEEGHTKSHAGPSGHDTVPHHTDGDHEHHTRTSPPPLPELSTQASTHEQRTETPSPPPTSPATSSASASSLPSGVPVPGYNGTIVAYDGLAPGPGSVIERTLRKRTVVTSAQCVAACSKDLLCTGVAFLAATGTCTLYSFISSLVAAIGALISSTTFVKVAAAAAAASPSPVVSLHTSVRVSSGVLPTTPKTTAKATAKTTSPSSAVKPVSSLIPTARTTAKLSSGASSKAPPTTARTSSVSIHTQPTSARPVSASSSHSSLPSSSRTASSGLPSSSAALPVSTTSSTPTVATSSSITTSASPSPTTPTCYYQGYDGDFGNIGYYADLVSGTFAGCNALCDANADCVSFGLGTLLDPNICILYAHSIIGLDLYVPGSGTTFFLRGGVCPPQPSSTSASATSASPLPSPIFPVCQSPGATPFNINLNNVDTTPFTNCGANATVGDSTFPNPNSVCQADVNGLSYCNSCNSCIGSSACVTDSDCPANFACITGSACSSVTVGAPTCIRMVYTADSSKGCFYPY